MRRHRRILIWALRPAGVAALFLLPLAPASAHPGIDEQIAKLDAEIQAAPDDGRLYLRRGELHRIHRDWKPAEADYAAALAHDPSLHIAEFCLGRLKLESGEPAQARTILDHYLEARPADPEALAYRARALVALGEPLRAAQDFTSAIHARTDAPRPENFLERARALASAGPEHVGEAIDGLDEGLRLLGQPVTLELYAIDLELERKNYDAALARVERIASQSVRQEPWLVRKASILEAAGRIEEARTAYRETLASIQTLPQSRRGNKAVERLEQEARQALERLDLAPASP